MIDLRPEHSRKADSSIAVTLGGMVIEVRLLQPLNAKLPIVVTLGGMVIDVRP